MLKLPLNIEIYKMGTVETTVPNNVLFKYFKSTYYIMFHNWKSHRFPLIVSWGLGYALRQYA